MDTSLYKPLLYIRKNYEESYIELYGLNITENSKLVYKGNILHESPWARIVGNNDISNATNNFGVNIYNNELIGYCGNTITKAPLSSDFNINNIVEIEFTGNSYFKVNNQIIDNTSKSTSFSRRTLFICGGNGTGNLKSVQQYIYRTKLYEDGTTLSYDFIPCKRLSDNVVGMYDKVHDRFYPPTKGTFYEPIIMDDVKSITIPEGKVVEIEDNEGRVLWSALPDPNKYAYGIRWDHTVPENQATTACERIGNLELHKTLPIQSKFATCIHQGTNIKYWCDPNDSRFRKDNTGFRIVNERIYLEKTTDAEKNTVSSDYSPSATYDYTIQFPEYILNKYEEAKLLVTTYKYLYAWIKINDVNIARVNKVDTVNKKAYITTDGLITGEAIVPTLEFGCSINGYDGEISVYTPKFYIWSVDKDGAGNEVWISEKKCVDYAREVKAHLIGISRCPLLRTAMNDDKWGWLNTLSDNTAVSVVNYQPNLRGGTNNTSYDQYLGDNNFRTMLGKAASSLSLSNMRTYTQKIKGSQVLYYQIWNAIVWCYFIEYADFNVKKSFNSNLTDEGYHQGGLGGGLISINNWNEYNSRTPNIPIDYTLSIGNNTSVVTNPSHSFTIKSVANTSWNIWNRSRITATINNKILNITAIPKLYNDWMLYTDATNVGGTHRYKIEGLTGGQTIVFKRQQDNLTITTDGEYDVNWGTNYNNRYITFGLVQESCNIKITILSSPAFTYTFTQNQLNIPCYRGFNVFWYGDSWLNIENFLSQYDSTSNKRKFYFTDNPNNFSNDINNKEHIIEINPNLNGWAKETAIGNNADLITNKISNTYNYTNCYRLDNTVAYIHTTFVGGSAARGTHCGLASLFCHLGVGHASSDFTFAKCSILN